MCSEKYKQKTNFAFDVCSLKQLPAAFFGSRYCLVGAGPSLDLCEYEIKNAIQKDTLFVVTDAAAFSFRRQYPAARCLFISVENRPHEYLRFLKHEHIFFYHAARRDNLPLQSSYNFSPKVLQDALQKIAKQRNFFYPFHLTHEKISALPCAWQDKSVALPSPGSVGGLGLSLILFLLLKGKNLRDGHITLLGLDFSYPDNRVFSRYAHSFLATTRFDTRERREFITVLKKTSVFINKNAQLVRSSLELQKSAQNCYLLLRSLPSGCMVEDFSPLGIQGGITGEIEGKIQEEVQGKITKEIKKGASKKISESVVRKKIPRLLQNLILPR